LFRFDEVRAANRFFEAHSGPELNFQIFDFPVTGFFRSGSSLTRQVQAESAQLTQFNGLVSGEQFRNLIT